jgi:hypothetical protein
MPATIFIQKSDLWGNSSVLVRFAPYCSLSISQSRKPDAASWERMQVTSFPRHCEFAKSTIFPPAAIWDNIIQPWKQAMLPQAHRHAISIT